MNGSWEVSFSGEMPLIARAWIQSSSSAVLGRLLRPEIFRSW